MPITSDRLVGDIMRQWPETIRVFLDRRFLCVGCPIASFHTVEDACWEHDADLAELLAALNETIRKRRPADAIIERDAIPAPRSVRPE